MSNNEKKNKEKAELFCALLKQEFPDYTIICYNIQFNNYDSYAVLKHRKEPLVTEVIVSFHGGMPSSGKPLSITKKNTRDLKIYGNKFGQVFALGAEQILPYLFYYVDIIMYLRDSCVDFFAKLVDGPTECYHVKSLSNCEYMEIYLPNEEILGDYLEELTNCYKKVEQIEEGVYKTYNRRNEGEAMVYVEKVEL